MEVSPVPSVSPGIADVIEGIQYTDGLLMILCGLLIAGFIAVLFSRWW